MVLSFSACFTSFICMTALVSICSFSLTPLTFTAAGGQFLDYGGGGGGGGQPILPEYPLAPCAEYGQCGGPNGPPTDGEIVECPPGYTGPLCNIQTGQYDCKCKSLFIKSGV